MFILSSDKYWIEKKENSLFLVIISIFAFALLMIICMFRYYPLEIIISFINIVLISGFATILSLIQIKKSLNEHFQNANLYIERIGKDRQYYYYLTVGNKGEKTALSCRARAFFGDYGYNLAWDDPSYPVYIDIPTEEFLFLFSI